MQFIQRLSRQQTLALIGGGCSLVTEQVVMIAHEKLIPVVSSILRNVYIPDLICLVIIHFESFLKEISNYKQFSVEFSCLSL